ncbi:FMN-dependent NADH-azoreductase 2 [Desulfosporosinus acididurans]|uniref:FMN dependent NADH:quinone oxidoreductase n=1 Tax=Desulfosporosinus acididurans TaxID=476652 RepID=A0A0J1FVH4_9FIRM|nr:NAD(P)H-dependent oxidoreductase [Desulfosporosinus acididurans]KLU67307.1 FMN-dependent NADH-azoreductase 2 [Desulfosporosinus acididurans]
MTQKLLYVKANPKADSQSNTLTLANVFVQEYQTKNPESEIVIIDLYKEDIKPLDADTLAKMFSGEKNRALDYANQFASADKYVIAAPMWNLGIPAILKAYFDYVSYVGVSFKYTAEGPIGLLADKPRKAVHISSRGGVYSEGAAKEFDLSDKYVRTILGFFGINQVESLFLENANVLQGDDLRKAIDQSHQAARNLAANF